MDERESEPESEDSIALGPTRAQPSPERGLLDSEQLEAVSLPDADLGFATRQRKAAVAAMLFEDVAEQPAEIGRYTILRELGAGGMGLVYLAYDALLDRRIAVKLLRGAKSQGKASERLQREAQAMARLSHPNVVIVHEVGTYESQLFVAMEFVEGQDLRGWMRAEPRPWPVVLALFLQAGEGLAAAHAAGIVHRDFKPDNVLVGDDGRVRVADFGLAYALDAGPDSSDSGDSKNAQTSKLDVSLTRTGAMIGTPAYMALEQFEGARTDARTDQFSFCVALWEGLYGRRPFTGDSLGALSAAVSEESITEPPADSEVPPWLRAAITRGLSAEPGQRWPGMRALLDVLGTDPDARRRRILRISAATVSLLALFAFVGTLAVTKIRENQRRGYWNALTEELLELERSRGLSQATDDARRARDATRMSVYRRFGRESEAVDHEDPTLAAVLLREVESEVREGQDWLSAANQTLGRSISHAVLEGHGGLVNALVFSPDGAVLYSGGADGKVLRWSVETGALTPATPIIQHALDVTHLALSPDGRTLVSSSKDGELRLWSEVSSEPAGGRVLARHDAGVDSVAFDPSGTRLVSASEDGEVRVIPLSRGEPGVFAVLGHRGAGVNVASFSPDGRRVLTGDDGHHAKLWTVEGELLATLDGHREAVYHARFVDDQRLLTASDDGSVRLWTLSGDGPPRAELFIEHTQPITSLELSGTDVLSTSTDGAVKIRSLTGGAPARTLRPAGERAWTSRFTPSGEHVVVAAFDGSAALLHAEDGSVADRFVGHREALMRASLDRQGRWLATGSFDGSIRIWDLQRPRLETPLHGHTGPILSVTLDSKGERILTASQDGSARVWDAHSGRPLATLVSRGALNSAEFSPDGRLVALASVGHEVELWDLETMTARSLHGHKAAIWRVAFDESGARLGSASYDNRAIIWDVARGEALATLSGHTDNVAAIDFEPGGARVVTASHDGTLRIWNASSGAPLVLLSGHEGRIHALARSPNGRLLATASQDGTARLWPDDDPAHALALRGHRDELWGVAFDDAGARVVTTSSDGDARVWSTESGALLATLSGHAAGLWAADFIGDARVVTVSADSTVRVWSLRDDAPPMVLSSHGASVTGLAVSPAGDRVVSASADASARIWRPAHLRTDSRDLLAQLRGATTWCMGIDARVRELGEDRQEAARKHSSCEDSYGR